MRNFTTQSERAAMVPDSVRKVMDRLRARVAGGAVRDSLMGVVPKDWDLATPLTPDEVMYVAKAMGFNVLPTGLQHGTVTVMVDGDALEVTTLRVDVATDGRHAEVEFTTDWKVDASRRDLTMNAMFMDLDGEVHDFFNGQEDLAHGVVRFVGNASERLQEDYLRVLRFFRFAGRMSASNFDPDALRAVMRNVNGLTRVSGERVWMELSKVLTGPLLREVLEVMVAHNVFSALGFPVVSIDHAVRTNAMGAKAETVLAALLDMPAEVEKAAREWKLSKAERDMARFVASHTHDRVSVQNWTKLEWTKLMVLEGRDRVLELLSLTDRVHWKEDVFVTLEAPVFPLTGSDMLNLGLEPGPEVGRKLRAAKQAWMDADFQLDHRKLVQLAATL